MIINYNYFLYRKITTTYNIINKFLFYITYEQQRRNTTIQKPNGETELEVKLEQETVWLSQKQIASLLGTEVPAISKHISNILDDGELEKNSTVSKMEIVQEEGKRNVSRNVDHYSLDMIISVGYRIKSKLGTQFRIWANKVLKDYLVKGYALNEKRLNTELSHYR